MKSRIKINLLPEHRGIDSNTFTGRPQGKQLRKDLKLDSKDTDDNIYEITIPQETTSFNPSFFLGLFFDSIKKLKGYKHFEEKYSFTFLEENVILLEGLEDDFIEIKRQAINEFEGKTGLSLW